MEDDYFMNFVETATPKSFGSVTLQPRHEVLGSGDTIGFHIFSSELGEIGFASLKICADSVEELGIFMNYQGPYDRPKGFGDRIMYLLLQYMDEFGIRKIQFSTTHENTSVHKLAERWGFRAIRYGGEGMIFQCPRRSITIPATLR